MKVLYYFIALVVILNTGCHTFLNEPPDNRTIVDSKEKVGELLVTAYTNAQYAAFTEVMSDNVADKGPVALGNDITIKAYKWKDVEVTGLDTPTWYWSESYKAIAHANQALASIKSIGVGEALNPLMGEALLARAYAHFMLVNLFSRRYDPATADAKSSGIPIVTSPEKNALPKYKRATIAQVYERIESDLIEGLPLLSKQYEKPKFHFTPASAHAFAARFYLYKGEWEKVVEHANQVLGSKPDEVIKDFTTQEYLALSQIQKARQYSSASEVSNLLINSITSGYGVFYRLNRYALSKEKFILLFEKNLQNHPFKKKWAYTIYAYEPHHYAEKYQQYSSYNNLVYFTNEEALLNRAEAYAMLSQWSEAARDIKTFLSKRTGSANDEAKYKYDPKKDNVTISLMRRVYRKVPNEYTPFYPMNFDQTVFVKGISELRRREFVHEGMRWFDVKRFNLVVKHLVYGEVIPMVLRKDDPRRAIQIPQSALAYGIKPNPR